MAEDRMVAHATFTVERTYPVAPSRVFRAFADPDMKAQWFAPPDDDWAPEEQIEFDFRTGGREVNRGGPREGPVHTFDARFWDIVMNSRIVYAYEMRLDEVRISVSLATVELHPTADGGTRLVYTEQGAFLDGHDTGAAREHGTVELLDALGAYLRQETAQNAAQEAAAPQGTGQGARRG